MILLKYLLVIHSEIIKMAKTLEMATIKLEKLLLQCLTEKGGGDFEYQLLEQDATLSNVRTGYFSFLFLSRIAF